MGTLDRKKREKLQRQNDMIDAAEEIFFTKGFAATTMDEVARKAEYSKGTLYLYFKNKEALYHAIILRGFEVLNDLFKAASGTQEKGIDKIRALGEAFLEFNQQHPKYYVALLYYETNVPNSDDDDLMVIQCKAKGLEILQLVAQVVMAGIEDGSIESTLDPFKTAVFLWSSVTGIVQLVSLKQEAFRDILKVDINNIVNNTFDMIEKSLEPHTAR